jgi:hypothetical protein
MPNRPISNQCVSEKDFIPAEAKGQSHTPDFGSHDQPDSAPPERGGAYEAKRERRILSAGDRHAACHRPSTFN